MSPRRIVIAYAGVSVLAMVLGAVGLTKLPSLPYVAVDLALEIAIIVGLSLLWRPVWVVAVALQVLGGLLVALHPGRGAVLLAIGAVQLGLLALRPLRQALQSRPVTA
ncbi:MAG: hypothetical protein QOD72_2806 [Acidimicrobiaceae bacterium]|jgi:hypothetical protein|nr:hypothetical protein [Acidimicrobiaceae bacterium]